MAEHENKKNPKKEVEARFGLRLAPEVLAALKDFRIYCNPDISIVHQQLAQRYLLRGEESGGAVCNLGAYSSFVDEKGKPLAWLQPVETVGPNGRHAIVLAPSFVRMHMVRVEHTYDLLITQHKLTLVEGRKKPSIESTVLFKGRQGTLSLDLWEKDASSRGQLCPVFYSYSGDLISIPREFVEAALILTAAVCCIGCRHTHLLQPPALSVPQHLDAAVESPGVTG
jgi:hypothetical protein